MKRLVVSTLLLAFFGVSTMASVIKPSPWEHSNAEVGTSAPTVIPGTNPIVYGPGGIFVRERELYGYNPRFKPNIVMFDNDNRPYILVGLNPMEVSPGGYNLTEDPTTNTAVLPRRAWMENAYIQTLGYDGQWKVIDIEELYMQIFAGTQVSNFEMFLGLFEPSDRVVFDADGGIYFISYARGYFQGVAVNQSKRIFYSPDGDWQNWNDFTLSAGDYLLETVSSFNSDKRPILLGVGGRKMEVYPVDKIAGGNLVIRDAVEVSDPAKDSLPGPLHTGIVNSSATVGYITHVVYLDYDSPVNGNETAQYYNYYNRRTGELGTPVFLGSTKGILEPNGRPDGHNGPTIVVDSEKNLHVVLGAHVSNLMYTMSSDNGKTWTTPVAIRDLSTYASLAIDNDDTLHLTFSSYNDSNDNQRKLWYCRKPKNQPWQDMGSLVEPLREGYSIYYHKLTTDRIGRLFLSYSYFAMNFNQAEIDEYTAKWPNDPVPNIYEATFAHDPVTLFSADGGDSWQLATTDDFLSGITPLVAYYSFDNTSELKKDYSGNARDFTSGTVSATTGKVGTAANFDGVSDYIGVSLPQEQIFSNGAFSISAWVKPLVIPTGDYSAVLDTMLTSMPAGVRVLVNNGNYEAYLYAPSDIDGAAYYQRINSNVAAKLNKWSHFTLTFEPTADKNAAGNYTGTARIYIDGVLAATAANRKFQAAPTANLTVGALSAGSKKYTGAVDELAIYAFTLSDSQVAKLVSTGISPKGIYSEAISTADINEDGVVDLADLSIIIEHWLQ